MATTSTKSTKTTKTTTTATPDVDVKSLLKQLADLQKEINTLKETQVVPTPIETVNTSERMIKFISLFKGSVLLKGTPKRPYEIEGQYNTRVFSETEAKVICSQMGGFMREGYVYIDDADFVREIGLTESYRNLLTPDQLKDLMQQNPDIIINAYKLAEEGQQRIIIDMIIEKQSKGEFVDANVLRELGKLSGVDLIDFSDSEDDK